MRVSKVERATPIILRTAERSRALIFAGALRRRRHAALARKHSHLCKRSPLSTTTKKSKNQTMIWTLASSMCSHCRTKLSRLSKTTRPRCARNWRSTCAAGRLCQLIQRTRADHGRISRPALPSQRCRARSRVVSGTEKRTRHSNLTWSATTLRHSGRLAATLTQSGSTCISAQSLPSSEIRYPQLGWRRTDRC